MRFQLESLRFDSKVGHALAHPLRVDLLEALQGGEASHLRLCDRLAAMNMERPSGPEYVLYHLKVLESAGCVERVRTVSGGSGREVFFRATPSSFIGGAEWSKVPSSLRATVQARSAEAFAEQVRAALNAGGIGQGDGMLTWSAITVDAQGAQEALMILRAARLRLIALHKGAVDRTIGEGDRTMTMIVGLAGFRSGQSAEAVGGS